MHIDFQPLANVIQKLAGNLIRTRISETVHFRLETCLLSASGILRSRVQPIMTIYSVKYTERGLNSRIRVRSGSDLYSHGIIQDLLPYFIMRLPDRIKTRGPRAEHGLNGHKRAPVFPLLLDGQILLNNTWLPLFSRAPQYSQKFRAYMADKPGENMATGLSCINQGKVIVCETFRHQSRTSMRSDSLSVAQTLFRWPSAQARTVGGMTPGPQRETRY